MTHKYKRLCNLVFIEIFFILKLYLNLLIMFCTCGLIYLLTRTIFVIDCVNISI